MILVIVIKAIGSMFFLQFCDIAQKNHCVGYQ
jgi:hypothetical protein